MSSMDVPSKPFSMKSFSAASRILVSRCSFSRFLLSCMGIYTTVLCCFVTNGIIVTISNLVTNSNTLYIKASYEHRSKKNSGHEQPFILEDVAGGVPGPCDGANIGHFVG